MLLTLGPVLLLGLTLSLLDPASGASSLGLTVFAVPQDGDGGTTVRAYFTAIAPSPCPSLSGLCAAGEDCRVYSTSLPFNGTLPSPGWCVRQWQKVVPSSYNASFALGSNTDVHVVMKAGPTVRPNTGRLNQPPYVALPPPLRARVNCPHDVFLSVKDLDGDRVRCRYARPEDGECDNCKQFQFLELDEERCLLTFTGRAQAGQYSIHLVAEDFSPSPKMRLVTDQTPLSSVPVQLTLTVEASNTFCSSEPVAYGETPRDGAALFLLPFQQETFTVSFDSRSESVSDIAVVGPPELFRTNFKSLGPLAALTMAWVRSNNTLPHLLPVCYVANTINLQSEPRCVWLYQRQMKALPAGTELSCQKTEMVLVLPVASLKNIKLAELQLNSATCPISYNSTHLTAHISLSGCGTKAVQAGSELVYTNTLQSVQPYTVISRRPSLILPLACRIPGAQVRGPQYNASVPTEQEAFGAFNFQLDFYLPGQGPLSKFTRSPTFRTFQPSARRRRDVVSSSGDNRISIKSTSGDNSRITQLDMYVTSNCSVAAAELIVSHCMESDTEDFTVNTPILQQGCLASNSILEILTTNTNVKIYRLDLSTLAPKGSMMYVQCTVNLCITTTPSSTCPDLCSRATSAGPLVSSFLTKSYNVTSGAISLLVTTPAPSTTVNTAAPTATGATGSTTKPAATHSTTRSYAPGRAPGVAAAAILTTLSVFLQNTFSY
ncbi:uncharacterized protein LOC114852797 [Betta splendens]|uniref:Uncharacterized protein LOC114852797 n=1 Tax=Betta splendens TaxID=158456 RepID=A0A6P7M2Q6_BETSP|nr:uncharacterized protein LOC114852797 [Betta splendens]